MDSKLALHPLPYVFIDVSERNERDLRNLIGFGRGTQSTDVQRWSAALPVDRSAESGATLAGVNCVLSGAAIVTR